MEETESKAPEKLSQSRRKFMKIGAGAAVGFATLVLGIPFLDSMISQSLRLRTAKFVKVGPVIFLPPGIPDKMFFDERDKDAYMEETARRDVWVVSEDPDMKVFSPICPHLGCRYNWNPKDQHFECPCHGSVFAKDGKVLHGPAPRPLDTLPHKVQGGILSVKWERFKLGISKKQVI